jgi:hypothetical protein
MCSFVRSGSLVIKDDFLGKKASGKRELETDRRREARKKSEVRESARSA